MRVDGDEGDAADVATFEPEGAKPGILVCLDRRTSHDPVTLGPPDPAALLALQNLFAVRGVAVWVGDAGSQHFAGYQKNS